MEESGVSTINWDDLKNGTTIKMKDFPSIRLLKLDNNKGCYFGYNEEPVLVDIKEYVSNKHGIYFYFQTSEDDWHPLTNRLWSI